MDYFKNIFFIPFFQKSLSDWEKKKKILISMADNSIFLKNKDTVHSDFYSQQISHNELIAKLFQEELTYFTKEKKLSICNLSNSWFEKASTGEFHGVHNHGQLGYSAVCYVTYDKNEHTPTQFVSPINDTQTGATEYYVPEINEGDLIIFPSALLHYTLPNNSKKQRLILSFNLKLE